MVYYWVIYPHYMDIDIYIYIHRYTALHSGRSLAFVQMSSDEVAAGSGWLGSLPERSPKVWFSFSWTCTESVPALEMGSSATWPAPVTSSMSWGWGCHPHVEVTSDQTYLTEVYVNFIQLSLFAPIGFSSPPYPSLQWFPAYRKL